MLPSHVHAVGTYGDIISANESVTGRIVGKVSSVVVRLIVVVRRVVVVRLVVVVLLVVSPVVARVVDFVVVALVEVVVVIFEHVSGR